MNISELYRQVNILTVRKYDKPMNIIDFFVVLFNMANEGKLIINDMEVYVNNVT